MGGKKSFKKKINHDNIWAEPLLASHSIYWLINGDNQYITFIHEVNYLRGNILDEEHYFNSKQPFPMYRCRVVKSIQTEKIALPLCVLLCSGCVVDVDRPPRKCT